MSENLTAPAHSTQQAYQPDDWNSLAFHGSGREYFGIWIVNLILTLITVGIYSAWATVRNRRYFYGNTELDGARFDFHATGLQILVGRVIAVVLLIVVTISAQISSLAPLVAMLLAAPLLPYLITSAFRFRRRHTSYRNIRFGFDGNTWAATKAFGVIIVAGALIIGTFFSLVFAQPDDSAMGGLAITAMVMVFFFVLFIVFLPALFIQAVQQFSMSYSRFGSLKFNGSIGIRETVLAYFLAGLYTNLILLGAALLFGTATWVNSALSIAFLVLSGLVIGFAYAFGVAYWKQAILTIVFRHLRLANIQFRASISTTKLAYILLINALLMTLTLGFYYPWAKVRLVRYLLSCIQLKGELPSAEEADPHSSHAIGEEMGEAFDIDIGV